MAGGTKDEAKKNATGAGYKQAKHLLPPAFSILRKTHTQKKSVSLRIVFPFLSMQKTLEFIHLSGKPQFMGEFPLSSSQTPVYL